MKQQYYGTKLVTAWPEKGGYAVKYENGYTSWSPKEVFQDHYQPFNKLNFSHALKAIQDGFKVCRESWVGKNIYLAKGLYLPEFEVYIAICPDQKEYEWEPTQEDILATDWRVIE